MLNIGFFEMILIAAIALIAIGPKQLPEVAQTVGRFINELKRTTSDLTRTVIDARDSTNQSLMSATDRINEHFQTKPDMPQVEDSGNGHSAFEHHHSEDHHYGAALNDDQQLSLTPIETPESSTQASNVESSPAELDPKKIES